MNHMSDSTRTLETTTLGKALRAAGPPGYEDLWSGLGQVWFDDASGGAWVKADPAFIMRVGRIYKWRDRHGRESEFLVLGHREEP